MVDVQEALPELDNLQGHKQGDGDQRDTDLHILGHAQVVALLARMLTPDERCDGAEEAHEQLHANDQPDLEVEEAPRSSISFMVTGTALACPWYAALENISNKKMGKKDLQLMACKLKLLKRSLSLHAVKAVLVQAAVTVVAED
ncbi:MAG: hypothetical protein FRX49_02243 [Trebouxia sp. A1-2]|nr:MAG: hypothetical protein FRX49_02243 [Trebouxia sp. A1-2]